MTPQKRLFDLTLAILLVPIVVPMIAMLAILLLVKQGRPLFHIAERMKTPTKGFGLVKFRTMTLDDNDAGVSGGDKDARVTPIGKRLRRTRLDELPQLWNVLCGHVSFVGPRPPLRLYVERFPEVYDQVLRSRPGLTGMASLHFNRHETRLLERCTTAEATDAVYCRRCIPRKAALDLIYQRNASLCHDMSLLLQTFAHLLGRR